MNDCNTGNFLLRRKQRQSLENCSTKHCSGTICRSQRRSTLRTGSFLNNGLFKTAASFGSLTTQRPEKPDNRYFPPMPPQNENLVWQTWIPLDTKADFVELQIWYPEDIVKPGPEDIGYLYQIELGDRGSTATDGLMPIDLTIKAIARPKDRALKLEIPA